MNNLPNTPPDVNSTVAYLLKAHTHDGKKISTQWRKEPIRSDKQLIEGQKGYPKNATTRLNHAAVCEFIEKVVDENPYQKDGYAWTQPLEIDAWARAVGLDRKAFERLAKCAPIRKRWIPRNGMIYRVDEQPDVTSYTIAKDMSKVWYAKFGKPTAGDTPEERQQANDKRKKLFGCLIHLANEWPDPWQERILWVVINRWRYFASVLKLQVNTAKEINAVTPEERAALFTDEALWDQDLDVARHVHPDELEVRFFEHPSIGVIRRFHYVAVPVFVELMQDAGLRYPGQIDLED